MKSLIVASLLLVSGFAVACPKGTEAYKDTCVIEIEPEVAQAVKPSDEKPPSEKMPSYQRPGVTVMDVPNMVDADAKADQEKAEAIAAGRHAAGLARTIPQGRD